MTSISEIAPDLYRISTYVSEANLQFNQFLVRDEQPFLFHTGMRSLFPAVRDAVAKLIDPATIRWIGFSHFEADECGSLRDWQLLAPEASAVCSFVAKMVSVDDVVAARPARAMNDGEVIDTGNHRLRFIRTPHVPHCWDAGLFFEETQATLLCSDLFHQNGDVEPLTSTDVVGRFRQTLLDYENGPFASYMPYTKHTAPILERLSLLKPKTIATMHGSTFIGNGEDAIGDLAAAMKEILGEE